MRDPRLLSEPLCLISAEQAQARVVEAKLVGEELAHGAPSREQFDAASLKVRGQQWFEFEAAFVRSLVGEHREGWLKVILNGMELQARNVDRFVPNREDAVQAMTSESQKWAERRLIEPWSIWTEDSLRVNLANYSWSRLLLQIDFARWMTTLDAVQSPSWLNELAFASDVREDRELLFQLVDAAPRAFDGWKPTGSVLALIAAGWLVEHVERIDAALVQAVSNGLEEQYNASVALQAFREDELPLYLQTAVGKLLARTDGVEIALHLIVRLGSKVIRAELGRSAIASVAGDFDISLVACDKLSTALRARGIRFKQYMELDSIRDKSAKAWLAKKAPSRSVAIARQPQVKRTKEHGEGGRSRVADALPVWVAAMGHVYAADPPEPDELVRLWVALESLLVARDSILRILVNEELQSTRIVAWMAHVLAKLDSPADRWTKAYARLEPQRRRAQYSLRYEDHDEGVPSMILLQVGSCAISLLSGDRQPERTALFEAMENAARRLWLTPGRDLGCDWRYLYARIVALTLDVFGSMASEVLTAIWRKVASNGWLLCASAKLLLDRGMSVGLLDDAARQVGVDLEAELAALKNWTQPTDTKGYPPGFDTLLEALASWRNGSAMAAGTEGCTLRSLEGDQKVECADV